MLQESSRLNSRNYNVIVIDLKLPDGDGVRVFQLVRKMNPLARSIGIAPESFLVVSKQGKNDLYVEFHLRRNPRRGDTQVALSL